MANGPSRGDLTGQQKAEASKTARREEQENAARTTMASEQLSYEEQTGTFDAQTGARVDVPPASAVLEEQEEVAGFGGPGPDYDSEPVLTGYESDEELAPILAQREQYNPRRGPRGGLRATHVKVRVNADVEKMTYGMCNGEPNNFNFREGLTYRVPIEIADHLEERGLVAQWLSAG